jgi:hypothetical protein
MAGLAFPFRMPPYAHHLLERVEDLSGKPVYIQEVAGLGHDSEARCAQRDDPVHELLYRPEYREFALHFFVNACKKFLRVLEAPELERYLPASDSRRGLPPEEHGDLARRIPPKYLEGASVLLQQGLVRQLTSFPVDLRVERELHRELREHREVQHAYLQRQVEDLEEHFSPAIAMWAPAATYAASTAMNVVLTEVACDLAEEDVPEYILDCPHRSGGQRLRAQLDRIEESGLRGDRRVTDAWAGELNLANAYEWVRVR